MLKRIKQTFITLGLASGIAAGALFWQHNPTSCRAMVLKDLEANSKFASDVSLYTAQQDFLTTVTKGK